jgi:hypothetical protein
MPDPFETRSVLPLASIEEREAILSRGHAVFRVVDAGFHAYMEIVTANPRWDDNQIEQELRTRGVEAALAEELVSFAPLAFGREVVEQLGVKCNELYRLHNLNDGTEQEMPLAYEMAYAYARAMVGLYRTAERNESFKLVALRSAELDAVNNSLHGGVTQEALKESKMGPSIVYLRRPARGNKASPT